MIESDLSIDLRSPLLMNPQDTALVVIDVQQKLLPHILQHRRIQWNIERLIAGAGLLGVSLLATEQYPQGLGETVPELKKALQAVGVQKATEKLMFSCRQCQSEIAHLLEAGISKVLLTGIETHVCVAQTGLDLMAAGFNVFIAVDAVGSRFALDHETAIRRLENSGAIATTTEAALFEWCEVSGTDTFKEISQLIRQTPPAV